MDGFQHLPSQQQQRFWVYSAANRPVNGFQPWTKPPGISFVHIICIGAGGGASSSAIWQTGVLRAGGGGGASGGLTTVLLPAYLVPDTLYVNIGIGGAGGAATNTTTANAGVVGTATYVTYYPAQTAGYILCVANGGGGGSPAGSAGLGGSAQTTTSLPISQIGLRNYLAGQNGQTGGSTAAPATLTAVYRISGGGGGGGNTAANAVQAGSGIDMAGDYALQRILSQPAGSDGAKIENLIQFLSSGGTGASSSTTISGSTGGFGGFGSGGGGGSVGPGLGGAGGRGGDGLVIITCG